MPQILGLTIAPLSSIILYAHAVAAVLFMWKEPLKAIYYGTRLEGDRTLFALVQRYIYVPAGAAIPYFNAAYQNNAKQKRICCIGNCGGALFILAIIFEGWLRGKEEWGKKHEVRITNGFTFVNVVVLLFLDGLLLFAVVEWEEWMWKREVRRLMAELKELKRLLAEREEEEGRLNRILVEEKEEREKSERVSGEAEGRD